MTAPTVASTLQLTHGVATDERAHVVRVLGRLDGRLRSFRDGTVDLRLGVKERDTASQRTTLEASVAGLPRLVATSSHLTFDAALAEVRDDMVRQLTAAVARREPTR